MYIRWKRRKGTQRRCLERQPRETLSAVLVENKRVNGKPCQRVVKYLGSIQFTDTNCPYTQQRFWDKIALQLASYDLDAEQRTRIENTLRTVVPLPTPEAFAQEQERIRVRLEELEQKMLNGLGNRKV